MSEKSESLPAALTTGAAVPAGLSSDKLSAGSRPWSGPRPCHTPGPWRIDEYSKITVWAGDTQNPMRICDIRGWGHLTGAGALHLPEDRATAIQDANARLIAAAPDLLEALQIMFDQIDRDPRAVQFFDVRLQERIRSTIAKAKGLL